MNLIFTCGGTAGHINPAIAVANMMRERHPDCNILFIGAKGHMEENWCPRQGMTSNAWKAPASAGERIWPQ